MAVIYEVETLSVTKRVEENLREAEKRILRPILEPKRINEAECRWRIKKKFEEFGSIYKEMKDQTTKWVGYIWV